MPQVQKRDLIITILLTVVTCGIYGIYWFIKLNDDLKALTKDEFYSGVKNFLLGIVTCNIWNVYWAYKVGNSGMEIQQMNTDPGSDQSILYLILTLLGWEIVVWALVQNDINKYVDTHGGAEVQPQA